MEGFTLGLALVDAIPVLSFGISILITVIGTDGRRVTQTRIEHAPSADEAEEDDLEM